MHAKEAVAEIGLPRVQQLPHLDGRQAVDGAALRLVNVHLDRQSHRGSAKVVVAVVIVMVTSKW
jgi:hypothetical protein